MKKTMRDLQAARGDRSNNARVPSDPNDVMEAMCSTCPWREDNGVLHEDPGTKNYLKSSVLNTSNQLCHSPAWQGKPETRICRGARNYQLTVFHGMGFLPEPTDQAWADKLSAIKAARKPKGFGKPK